MNNAWLLRPSPHYNLRITEFIKDGIIAIGWPELSNLAGNQKNDIKTKLSTHPKNYSKVQLGLATSAINSFVNLMNINDIVVVPNKDDIYFFKVVSDYFFDASKATLSLGYPHQRKVLLIRGPESRDKIPTELRKSISTPKMLANLSGHSKLIDNYLYNTNVNTISYIEVNYPLRSNVIVTIRIPSDINHAESIKLSDFVKTLYF